MGEVGQTVDDSYFCLDWVVPKGMSQVWRRLEVGNHKRRTLNTRLSSGTSEHTSSSSRNAPGRMLRSDLFCYWYKLKMKLTYREKNLQDYLFGGFRSTPLTILANRYGPRVSSRPSQGGLHPRLKIANITPYPVPP
jgi:hypothetical protein